MEIETRTEKKKKHKNPVILQVFVRKYVKNVFLISLSWKFDLLPNKTKLFSTCFSFQDVLVKLFFNDFQIKSWLKIREIKNEFKMFSSLKV